MFGSLYGRWSRYREAKFEDMSPTNPDKPLFCEGRGPFRWATLSGDPNDVLVTDEALLDLFAHDAALHRWIRMAQKRVEFQGLPARICWLGYGERDQAGIVFNDLVRPGKVKAPIFLAVITSTPFLWHRRIARPKR